MNELNMFTDDDFDKDFDKDEIFVGHEINKDLVNTDFLSKKNQKVYYFRNIRVRLFGNVPKSYIKRVLTILDYYFNDFMYYVYKHGAILYSNETGKNIKPIDVKKNIKFDYIQITFSMMDSYVAVAFNATDYSTKFGHSKTLACFLRKFGKGGFNYRMQLTDQKM
jgi:hypothetical protein